MSRAPAPHGRTGRPPLTSRAQILEVARRLIDQDGWEKLTVRRLAGELGVGATTLYHHIRNKDELLLLLLHHHSEQVERPVLPPDPRDRIVVAATAMHDALAAWPWAAEILLADGFVGQLDESALWMVEAILAGADAYGCTPEQTVDVFRNVWYYTVGEVLVRAHSARRTDAGHLTFRETFDASQVPHLAAVGGQWAALAARDIYPRGLRALVDGLLAQVHVTSATPREAG
ncbi:TetR/AcrR family transcriptional regulator [Streptomyces sp. NPDC059352]|uniref:TetR/AcrR family transcriptional regulator n=1 Tax=Streptomyces sp. NPDC059352 TaxID=3346810 RepID=UPI0036D0FBB9